jgi:hypothetical protein
MILAFGKWRVELRLSRPLVDIYIEWPRRWGLWRGEL